jgi:hypothetical protein
MTARVRLDVVLMLYETPQHSATARMPTPEPLACIAAELQHVITAGVFQPIIQAIVSSHVLFKSRELLHIE